MWGLAAEMIICWQKCAEEKKKADLAAMHNHLGDSRRLFETEKNERKKRMPIFDPSNMSASVAAAHLKRCMAPGAINIVRQPFDVWREINPAEMWHKMEDNTLTVEKMRAAVRLLKENNYKPNFDAIARERAQRFDDEIYRSYSKGKPTMGSNVNTHSTPIGLGVKRHSAIRITVDGYKDNRSGNSVAAGHPKEPVVVIGRDSTGSTIAIPAEQIEVVVDMLREAAKFATDSGNTVKQFAAAVGISPDAQAARY